MHLLIKFINLSKTFTKRFTSKFAQWYNWKKYLVLVSSFCSGGIVLKFFFYIKDFREAFLLNDRNFRYFGINLLLIQWGSDDQTLENFRKTVHKEYWSHKIASNTLLLCASTYFYLVITWEIMRGNNLNGKHDE